MSTYVYSFEDTSVIFSHPNFETYSAYGTGIGSVQVSMANDITTHDVAADLSVVVSKSVKKNGTVTLSWKKVKNATGYIVSRATAKNGTYKKVAKIKKITYTDKANLTFQKKF